MDPGRAADRGRAESALGHLLRRWRARRRLSQLDLALEAGISARHLSFVETGRAQPSREMVLRLTRALDVPLRDRNDFLTVAGYAPIYRETNLEAPRLAQVRRALEFALHSRSSTRPCCSTGTGTSSR